MDLPLSGVRILDFGHVATGPFATSLLADFGADVIKVESATAVEPGRRLGPFRPDGPRDPEGSAFFASLNRNKRSAGINLKHPQGVEIALALADRCDAVTENFSVGVMDRLGLGPTRLLERNPRLIYVSMSGLGSGGPRSDWVSFNVVIQALSGLMLATGRPGDPPVAVSNSWADFVAGLHAAVVLAAALARRGRDGQGCWIDLSQYEANVLPLGHLVMAAEGNGHVTGRMGNRSASRVPQGCYPCHGEDTWCVISVGAEEEWQGLVEAIGDPDLLDPRYGALEGRRAHVDQIDARLETWTRQHPARHVETVLQQAGVPAAAVRTNVEVMADLSSFAPSYQTVEHPVIGTMPMLPNPIHFEGAAVRLGRAGPRLGEHTGEVLRELLGTSDAELDHLKSIGALA
jgi:benzylsuccinate CoA-transferase BbsF subunit